MRPVSIKSQKDFDGVFDKGKRYHGGLLTAVIAKVSGPTKLGIIASHKFGGSVARNRIKRQIREAFRSAADKFTENAEIVVIPKEPARRARMPEILADLSSIIHRAGITQAGNSLSRT